MPHWRCRSPVAALLFLLTSAPLAAQTAENVLVVVNEESAVSRRIGDRYLRARDVPADHLVKLRIPPAEEIDRAVYERQIEAPIAAWLQAHNAQDRILYIVLTKDVPLRVGGTGGINGTVASVDSELALLYRKMLGRPIPIAGRVPNPYFAAQAGATYKLFTHAVADIYLVTRLDGFSEGDVAGVIDRGLSPAKTGMVVLDERGTGSDRIGDEWLERAAEALRTLGVGEHIVLERTTALAGHEPGVIGYYSWGSNDPSFRSRRINMDFAPGAIAATYVSTDARTFHEPPADWTISSDWSDKAKLFAGSPQSLTGDLIRQGVTGAAGHVAEPYLDATIKPHILFPAYLSGMNVAEAFYRAMPFLSWQTVVVGDPLCAPFRTATVSTAEIDSGLDPLTELPKLFSDQLLKQVAGSDGSTEAAAQFVRGERRLKQGDRSGARGAFEEALRIDASLTAAERALGMLAQAEGRKDEALRHFQHVVARSPDDVIGLNNLAYALATDVGKPAEALTFAQRAARLAPNNVNVLDTLGWVYHLTGDDNSADIALQAARELHPRSVDVWVHSAEVHLALGNAAAAQDDITAALAIDATVTTRDDVMRLQKLINVRRRESW